MTWQVSLAASSQWHAPYGCRRVADHPIPLDWQRAAVEMQDAAIVSFDLDALNGLLRVELRVGSVLIAVRPLWRNLSHRLDVFHVYAGPLYPYDWAQSPDGVVMSPRAGASPAVIMRAIAWHARKLAATRCHAGAGHAPGLPRGPFGDLCPPCWVAIRDLLDIDKEPLPF